MNNEILEKIHSELGNLQENISLLDILKDAVDFRCENQAVSFDILYMIELLQVKFKDNLANFDEILNVK